MGFNKLKILFLLIIPIATTIFVIVNICFQKKITPQEKILQFIWTENHKTVIDSKEKSAYFENYTINKIRENSNFSIYSVINNLTRPNFFRYYSFDSSSGEVTKLMDISLWRKVEYKYNIDWKYCFSDAINVDEFNKYFSFINYSVDSLVDNFCKLLADNNHEELCIRVNSPEELNQLIEKQRLEPFPRVSKDSLFLRNGKQKVINFDFLRNKENGVYYYYYSILGLVRFDFFINKGKIYRVNSTLIGELPWMSAIL